jgi:hypothetical protein
MKTKMHYPFERNVIFINDKQLPIIVCDSKLVLYPSMFVLFLIQHNRQTFKDALKSLTIISEFLDYLIVETQLWHLTPDELIQQCSTENILRFIEKNKRPVRPKVEKLLREFFQWLIEVEGVFVKNNFPYGVSIYSKNIIS